MTTTTDDAALLAAICAEPAEDTPRLAYADWLDEQGDARVCHSCGIGLEPGLYAYSTNRYGRCRACDGKGILSTANADRAELIRVQVELARIENHEPDGEDEDGSDRSICSRVASLRSRSDELLRLHEGEWSRWACGAVGREWVPHREMQWTFTRGFIGGITCTAREWTADRERRADVGKCHVCEGKGRGGHHDEKDIDGNLRCVHCDGTGRRTRGDGFAARVVLACPVAGVTLGDREPYRSLPIMGGDAAWAWVNDQRTSVSPDTCNIPDYLWDRLEGNAEGSGAGVYKRYPTLDAAHQALSAACVAWARAEAGLPATGTAA